MDEPESEHEKLLAHYKVLNATRIKFHWILLKLNLTFDRFKKLQFNTRVSRGV